MIDRINLILRAKNMTARQFAEEIGVQQSGLSHVLSGRNNPSLDFVMKIVRRFPEIDINWLLFGKGEMYVSSFIVQNSFPHTNSDVPAVAGGNGKSGMPIAPYDTDARLPNLFSEVNESAHIGGSGYGNIQSTRGNAGMENAFDSRKDVLHEQGDVRAVQNVEMRGVDMVGKTSSEIESTMSVEDEAMKKKSIERLGEMLVTDDDNGDNGGEGKDKKTVLKTVVSGTRIDDLDDGAKEIEKIIVLYTNHSFAVYNPKS